MKIVIHADRCLSCGSCASIAPHLFSIDTGTVTLVKDPATYTEEDKEQARQAAAMCPGTAVEIVEE
jgi:ferredoxin